MSDRKNEVEALREFMKEYSEASVYVAVEDLRQNYKMFMGLGHARQGLLRLLVAYDAVQYANVYGGEVEWVKKRGRELHDPYVYRIAPGYELPDLTEVMPPRFANGAYVCYGTGTVVQVVDRSRFTGHVPQRAADDWFATLQSGGDVCWDAGDGIKEVPSKPNEAKLAEQGYKLTGKVADCRARSNGHLYVNWNPDRFYVLDGEMARSHRFGGYRWLIEKIVAQQPFYKSGTWLISPDGDVVEVVDRSHRPNQCDRLDDWYATRDWTGHIGYQQKPGYYKEIPAKPDEARLAEQGYKLTMGVADCGKAGHGYSWVENGNPYTVQGPLVLSNCLGTEGYRWIVTKIATPVVACDGHCGTRSCGDCKNYEPKTDGYKWV